MQCDQTGGSGTFLSRTYNFHDGNGNNGNVWAVVDNLDADNSIDYDYDQLNRIKTAQSRGTDCNATYPSGQPKNWGNSYTIDPWGNLTNKDATKCNAEYLNQSPNINNQLTNIGSYDLAGNLTAGGTYVYDAESRIVRAAGYAYGYDGDGNRVSKSPGKLYWYGAGNVLAESDADGNVTAEYVFFDGRRVARVDMADPSGPVNHYYLSDHLGSTSAIVSETGKVEQQSEYYPYGGERVAIAGDSNAYKFTGKERDTETGLDYFGARYYGSNMGRFMSTDPQYVQERMATDPQSWNLYEYARNNPLHFVDPTGEAIQLDGDEEHRKKELAAIQAAVGAKAGAYLYDNAVTDANGNTSHFVGIYTNGPDGKSADFSTINSASNEISQIIGSKDIAQISVVHAWESLPGQPIGKDQSLAERGAVGLTIPGKNVRIYVQDPSDKFDPVDGWKMSNGRPGIRTVGTVTGHELGHGWAFMRYIGGEYQNNKEALDLENKVRTLKNPSAPTRTAH